MEDDKVALPKNDQPSKIEPKIDNLIDNPENMDIFRKASRFSTQNEKTDSLREKYDSETCKKLSDEKEKILKLDPQKRAERISEILFPDKIEAKDLTGKYRDLAKKDLLAKSDLGPELNTEQRAELTKGRGFADPNKVGLAEIMAQSLMPFPSRKDK